MNHLKYNRVRDRRPFHGSCRGFRLNARRFAVHRLRAKFYYLFKILTRRWQRWFKHARNIGAAAASKKKENKDQFVAYPPAFQNRLRSFGRSNSFYSEAIADCLEFIKRSSVNSTANDIHEEQEEYALVQEQFHVN